MEDRSVCHPFDGLDRFAIGLDAEHQARADQRSVDRYRTSATIAGAAAFLGAGHVEFVRANRKQRLVGVRRE
jgi:hypothetical protein